MATSDDLGSGLDNSTSHAAETSGCTTPRDVVAMGVGAVMTVHCTCAAEAMESLARVATRYQIPVADVAQAVLTLVAGSDELLDDAPGRVAAQLLAQGLIDLPLESPEP